MLTLGERLAIIFPSIFYNIIVVICLIENFKLMCYIVSNLKTKEKDAHKLYDIISFHIFSTLFIEFIILSITNGLCIIFGERGIGCTKNPIPMIIHNENDEKIIQSFKK